MLFSCWYLWPSTGTLLYNILSRGHILEHPRCFSYSVRLNICELCLRLVKASHIFINFFRNLTYLAVVDAMMMRQEYSLSPHLSLGNHFVLLNDPPSRSFSFRLSRMQQNCVQVVMNTIPCRYCIHNYLAETKRRVNKTKEWRRIFSLVGWL